MSYGIFVMAVIVLWLLPILVGQKIGIQKGHASLGVWFGILLGWLGVLLMVFVSETEEARRTEALYYGFACPFCQEHCTTKSVARVETVRSKNFNVIHIAPPCREVRTLPLMTPKSIVHVALLEYKSICEVTDWIYASHGWGSLVIAPGVTTT